LIHEIIQKYQKEIKHHQIKGKKKKMNISDRLNIDQRHFPEYIGDSSTKKQRRQCYVCSNKAEGKKRKDTFYQCKECDVGLCAAPCFNIYHTKNIF